MGGALVELWVVMGAVQSTVLAGAAIQRLRRWRAVWWCVGCTPTHALPRSRLPALLRRERRLEYLC